MNASEEFTVEILEEHEEILKYLHLGINIPVLHEFRRFIISDFKVFNTKSIVVKIKSEVVAHTIIYDAGEEVLYFGFFRVLDHKKKYIELLLDQIVIYAGEHQFNSIQGPINVPTFIFGWGFMQEGGKESLFVGKPVNPPIYQKVFLDNAFTVKSTQGTWEGDLPVISTDEIGEYDQNEYEIYQLKDWDDLNRFRVILLMLSAKNLSPQSQVTPKPFELFDNFVDFVKTYGDVYMAQFLRYKLNRQFVGCCVCLPNPLSKNSKGDYDSIVTYVILINKEHRSKGLGMHLLKTVYDKAFERNVRYMSAPIEASQAESTSIVKKKFGYSGTRTHIVLERKLE